jgi:uncharacterized protein (DUF1330 family)
MTLHTEPTKEQLKAFLASDIKGPIQMLNLIRFKKNVVYPSGERATGAKAYQAYAAESGPIFAGVGGKIVWRGDFKAMVIGPAAERWDAAFIAEYPNLQAFKDMISDPAYQKAVRHRRAAVETSRLICLTKGKRGKGF